MNAFENVPADAIKTMFNFLSFNELLKVRVLDKRFYCLVNQYFDQLFKNHQKNSSLNKFIDPDFKDNASFKKVGLFYKKIMGRAACLDDIKKAPALPVNTENDLENRLFKNRQHIIKEYIVSIFDTPNTLTITLLTKNIDFCRLAESEYLVNIFKQIANTIPAANTLQETLTDEFLESAVKIEEWFGKEPNLSSMTTLDLSGHSVPQEIKYFTNLTTLYMYSCNLQTIPSEIGFLTNLQQLFLHNNAISQVPEEMTKLTSLRRLGMEENNFRTIPIEIIKLTNLTKLNLTDNRIQVIPSEICQMISLKKLFLGGNALSSIPKEIGQLSSLEKLSFEDNQICALPTEMGLLTSLCELEIAKNRLTTLPRELGQLSSLRRLDFKGNPIETIPEEIRNLPLEPDSDSDSDA